MARINNLFVCYDHLEMQLCVSYPDTKFHLFLIFSVDCSVGNEILE